MRKRSKTVIYNKNRRNASSHLGSSAHLKRPKDDVHDPLGREDIPSHHSCILGRLEDGARGYNHFDWCQAALKGEIFGQTLND